MTDHEHEHAEPDAIESAPRRRGTFQPAADPIAPTSIEEAEGLIMPVYAEPVARDGGSGAAPTATEAEAGEEPAAASRLRRGAHIASAGMIAALIAVVAAAFLPTPHTGTTAYDSPALADAPRTPGAAKEERPLASERGRVDVDLHETARPTEQPAEAAPPAAGAGAQASTGTDPATSAPAPTEAPASERSAAASPEPTAPAPSPSPSRSEAPSPAPSPTPTSTPAPTPSASQATTAPLTFSVVVVERGLLGVVAPRYRVDLVGEPGAEVRVSTGLTGIAAQTVTLDAGGTASVTFRGLLNLAAPRVEASYV